MPARSRRTYASIAGVHHLSGTLAGLGGARSSAAPEPAGPARAPLFVLGTLFTLAVYSPLRPDLVASRLRRPAVTRR